MKLVPGYRYLFMGALYSHVIIDVGSTVLWPQK